MRSSTSPPRTSTPDRAARPMANEVASGVAMPSAHGQATTSTASAASPPFAGPAASVQNSPAPRPPAPARPGRTPRRRARQCAPTAYARARASSTISMIRRSSMSSPTRSARTTSPSPPLTVPAITSSPGSAGARLRLAGERGLLDDRAALEDAAVHRDPLAGPDAHAVAGAQLADGDFARAVGLDPQRRARQQRLQAADQSAPCATSPSPRSACRTSPASAASSRCRSRRVPAPRTVLTALTPNAVKEPTAISVSRLNRRRAISPSAPAANG